MFSDLFLLAAWIFFYLLIVHTAFIVVLASLLPFALLSLFSDARPAVFVLSLFYADLHLFLMLIFASSLFYGVMHYFALLFPSSYSSSFLRWG